MGKESIEVTGRGREIRYPAKCKGTDLMKVTLTHFFNLKCPWVTANQHKQNGWCKSEESQKVMGQPCQEIKGKIPPAGCPITLPP